MSRYRYLPWVREGAAHAYDTPDKQAAVLARSDGKPISVVPIGLLVNDRTRVDVPLRIYGPGDVVGIDPRAVLRTDPLRNTGDFEPNYLACIEFDIPDFPWLFTPAAAGTNGRLRPWLALVVVKPSEDVVLHPTSPGPLPQLDAPVGELPDLADSWAWAHAQVVELDASQTAEQILASEPDRNLSRLVCPRRLEPETRYLACVVPTFEAGRKAGLGGEVTAGDEDKLAPAWGADGPPAHLPVYYHWEFATGAGGDFETLARRLKPRAVGPDVGKRKLRVGKQPFGLPNAGVLQLEGALVAPGELTRPVPPDAFRQKLRELLNLSAGEPVVTPPIYGHWQASSPAVPADADPPNWLRELSLDPSARAVAGFGVVVVQEAQEELVASAWSQLGDPTAVAHVERRLEVAVAVLDSVMRRRVQPMDTGRLVQFLGPAQARLRMSPQTLHAVLRDQNLPSSFSSPSFRRLVRPGGAPSRVGFPGSAPPLQRMATRLGSIVPVVGPAPTAPGLVTQTELVQQVNKTPRTRIAAHLRYRDAAAAVRDYVNQFFGVRAIESRPTFQFDGSLKATLVAKLEPQVTAPARFYARVSAAAGTPVEPPAAPGDSVLFTPKFPQPMYEPLRDLSAEYLLPGVGSIDIDTVTLLNDNPRFIEAYMVGLNHELAGELLWREFPSDMRSTFFQSFWDSRGTPSPMAQLPAIHLFAGGAGLGQSYGAGVARVVLLIRGELLHRYPDALIYAAKAKTLQAVGTEEKVPLFRGRIDPDITFLGFDLTEAAARGDANDPGWFFVIQEQPTAPRFGFDDDRSLPLDTWNDLAWTDIGTAPGAHVKVAPPPAAPADPGGLTWAFNGAHLAGILRQRPVRIAIHARQLLPK